MDKSRSGQKKKYIIPDYSKKKLLNESRLFLQWYLPTVLKKEKIRKAKKNIENIFNNLYKNE